MHPCLLHLMRFLTTPSCCRAINASLLLIGFLSVWSPILNRGRMQLGRLRLRAASHASMVESLSQFQPLRFLPGCARSHPIDERSARISRISKTGRRGSDQILRAACTRAWARDFVPRLRAFARPSFASHSSGVSVLVGYRRVNLPGFPYYVAYFIRGEQVLVAAVGHGSRHPDYWKRRQA